MAENAKEILDKLKDSVDNPIIDVPTYDGSDSEPMNNIALLKPNACKQLLDYITNLQQLYENALKVNQNEQKYRTELESKYVLLQQENEKLKQTLHNITINDVEEENTTVLDLINENKELNRMCELYSKSLYNAELTDYKSRCKKTTEYIKFVINHYKEQLKTSIEDTYFNSDVNRKGYILSIIAYLQTT